MKERLLEYLACPACQGPLKIENAVWERDEIREGKLICGGCAAAYPIRDFVPRFVEKKLIEQEERTRSAWGFQWNIFDELHDSYREQFLDWIYPVRKNFFRDKVVVDAGCGMGRFTMLAAEFGAREVIGFDLSRAVDAAARLGAGIPNLHIIQADIYSLPLKQEIDFIYSIGVIHHLPNPYEGFSKLCRLLKPGGAIHVWVYGYENNEFIVKYLNPLREKLTSRLPYRLLYFLTFFLTLPLHFILKTVYLPSSRCRIMSFLKPMLPYRDYLSWLSRYSFRHNHHVIFDHLVAPIAHYIPRAEIESWYQKEGLKKIRITPRNNNSWRGFGIR